MRNGEKIGFVEKLFVFKIDDHLFSRNFDNIVANIYFYPDGNYHIKYEKYMENYPDQLQEQILKQMEIEKELLGFKLTFSTLLIHQVVFLDPIISSDRGMILPVMYIFADKRAILKFKTAIEERDFSQTDGSMDLHLGSISFTKRYKITESKLKKNRKREFGIDFKVYVKEKCIQEDGMEFQGACNLYLDELTCIDNNSNLVTNYINIIFTNKVINKETDKKYMKRIAKAPIYEKIKDIDDLIYFNGIFIFSSSKRTICAPNENLFTKLVEKKEEEKEISLSQDEYNYISLLGNYQLILEALVLKWFKVVFLSTNINMNNSISVQLKNKINLKVRYTNTENIIAFANYETIAILYNRMSQYFFPKEAMELLGEQNEVTDMFGNFLQEEKLNNITKKFTALSIILTLLFSYEPIQNTLKAVGYDDYSLYVYIIFNIIIFVILFKSYKI